MSPQNDDTPRIALVTGAGRGLGRQLAGQLAAQGLRVAALGRRPEDLDSLAAEHADGAILPLTADVGDIEAMRSAFARIDTDLGPLDILINNAAVYPKRDFLEETPESFRRVVEINLGGVVTCMMLALDRMVARGRGRIITVGSFAGIRPAHLSSAYSVSKGATRILTSAVVKDLRDRFPDIVMTEWMPGILNTEMGRDDGIDPETAARWGVALALMTDRGLNGATFERDREKLPPLSRKRRLINALTGRSRVPQQIRPLA
jgi:NAD(P)-dependent dehydrogenase (short-subunit alcohol dehydrogenase family)